MNPVLWRPDWAVATTPSPEPPVIAGIDRGLPSRRPPSGKRSLFDRLRRVVPQSLERGTSLASTRAGDAPLYLVILITCHLLVSLMRTVFLSGEPAVRIIPEILVATTCLMAVGLVRPEKGGAAGLRLNPQGRKSGAAAT